MILRILPPPFGKPLVNINTEQNKRKSLPEYTKNTLNTNTNFENNWSIIWDNANYEPLWTLQILSCFEFLSNSGGDVQSGGFVNWFEA